MKLLTVRSRTRTIPNARVLGRTGALLFIGLLTACTGPAVTNAMGGMSGMAQIDDSRYLFVRDLKSNDSGPRLGVFTLDAGQQYNVTDVATVDWQHSDGPASDLEAACAIPGLNFEFLVLESGHWQGSNGRLFRIRLAQTDDAYSAAVIHVFELPEFDPKGPDDPGDEMEGLACASQDDGNILVILGERGGSEPYPNGLLRWFTIDLDDNSESWPETGKAGLEVDAPGGWHDPQTNRDISALHVHSDGSLWAAAAEDLSDAGPFSSVVYRLGSVRPNEETPVQLSEQFRVHAVLSGFKVEALASGTPSIPETSFAVGTEDEVFGGTWRPLR